MSESLDLLLDGERFAHWDDIELVNSIDRFSTLSFSAPFQPERAEFRARFRPFSFQPVRVYLNGESLYKGTLVGVDPEYDASQARVGITGYALPGVLDDCNAPAKTKPQEFKKVDLRTIAEALAGPFDVSLRFDADPGKKFTKAKLTQEKHVLEFLIELAQQRGLVIGNDAEGAALFWKSVEVGNPVAIFVEGEQPITKVRGSFSPQEYFSEITGWGHPKRGHRGKSHTEQNPWLDRGAPLSKLPGARHGPGGCRGGHARRDGTHVRQHGDVADRRHARVARPAGRPLAAE
jgi:prophage tail gpP-like protein